MIKISVLLIVSVILAWLSQQQEAKCQIHGRKYIMWTDPWFVILILVLTFFAGLRTAYNDTWNYINGFRNASGLGGFLSNPDNFDPFSNPLFYLFRAALRSLTGNAQILILLTSFFTQLCFVLFLRRYSENFTFSIFIYFALGTFTFSLAAIKQVLAMSILTLAFPHLLKKHWLVYYLFVFIAMLVHTYAIAFAVLPLFMRRPWKTFTYAFVLIMVVVMLNFEEVITAFMEQANEAGKSVASYEVFDDYTVNILRVAVYAILPLLSLVFKRLIFYDSNDADHLLIHMSILSLAFISMGTQSGANMFARMATYFELGTVCIMPKVIRKIFDDRSQSLAFAIASACFLAFFVFDNAIAGNFDGSFSSIALWELFTK